MVNTLNISAIVAYLIALIAFKNITSVEPYFLKDLPDGRIVGGISTTIHRFPHQISLRYQRRHRCGGSIISNDVVLTAAHCVVGINQNQLVVRAGTTFKEFGGIDIKVSKVIVHEDYSGKDNDIAILILSDSLKFSPKIQAVTLDDNDSDGNNNNTQAGTVVFVSGWGSLRENGFGPNILNYASVLIVSQEACSKAYSPEKISKGMICAGLTAGGRDSCQGDSGGPLVVYNENIPKLVGVVSWGNGCARPGYPGVYARVATYTNWISSNVELKF